MLGLVAGIASFRSGWRALVADEAERKAQRDAKAASQVPHAPLDGSSTDLGNALDLAMSNVASSSNKEVGGSLIVVD